MIAHTNTYIIHVYICVNSFLYIYTVRPLFSAPLSHGISVRRRKNICAHTSVYMIHIYMYIYSFVYIYTVRRLFSAPLARHFWTCRAKGAENKRRTEYIYTNEYIYIYMCITYTYVQPIPLGVTFSNAVSKIKAQSSNVSFATFQ